MPDLRAVEKSKPDNVPLREFSDCAPRKRHFFTHKAEKLWYAIMPLVVFVGIILLGALVMLIRHYKSGEGIIGSDSYSESGRVELSQFIEEYLIHKGVSLEEMNSTICTFRGSYLTDLGVRVVRGDSAFSGRGSVELYSTSSEVYAFDRGLVQSYLGDLIELDQLAVNALAFLFLDPLCLYAADPSGFDIKMKHDTEFGQSVVLIDILSLTSIRSYHVVVDGRSLLTRRVSIDSGGASYNLKFWDYAEFSGVSLPTSFSVVDQHERSLSIKLFDVVLETH